ncbi:Uncharacterized phage-associated protein [Flaviramulus basaltis]|uniref:Uncharacterized phage-associated protein n=1 Tax=Flaviramulus basaltis TaxID=369401 RepID=A0A1K2IDH1_9FLAO|nr:type II toxin-antitoxin system antitoxin SocA domain-containing protein [Flaviramulus basaltis]SFZ90344.1 Uncharacterized phage-associated protein [Flaviramulus basaltis]
MESLNNFKSIKVSTLSGYILKYFGPMSHLKLQKLLYYCQAYHLAHFEEPLFEEDFEAWVHGPVCRSVYNTLKGKSILYSDVTYSEYDFDSEINLKDVISSSQLEVVDEVLETLSKWTGLELESATHKETPWIEARLGYSQGDICNVNISKASMLNFYRAEMNG